MEITTKSYGLGILYVQASGRLDLDSAVDFGMKVKDTIEDSEETVKEVVIDFAEITFISSLGLKVILELYKQWKASEGVLKLKNVSEDLMHSFRMVGFDKFLIFE